MSERERRAREAELERALGTLERVVERINDAIDVDYGLSVLEAIVRRWNTRGVPPREGVDVAPSDS